MDIYKNARQLFLTPEGYVAFQKKLEEDKKEHEVTLGYGVNLAEKIHKQAYQILFTEHQQFLLRFTAGVPLVKLRDELLDLVKKHQKFYEVFYFNYVQTKKMFIRYSDEKDENDNYIKISLPDKFVAFTEDDSIRQYYPYFFSWVIEQWYERDALMMFTQMLSLCVLLHREEWLRFFEEPCYYMFERNIEFDFCANVEHEWLYRFAERYYPKMFRKLPPLKTKRNVGVGRKPYIYGLLLEITETYDPKLRSSLLAKFCSRWYPSLKDSLIYESHLLTGTRFRVEGAYPGYWAFEANLMAYLYEIDDKKIKNMTYCHELTAFAREFKSPL